VKVADRTILLGDWWFGPRAGMCEVLDAMNGSKVLVLGNHDRGSVTQTNGWAYQREYLDAGFEAVVDYATVTLPQVKGGAPARKVLLSHFPYHADHKDSPRFNQFRLRDEGMWLVHGHVHGLYTVRDRGVNVGVDVWDFYPVQDHEVAKLIDDVESGRREEF
jgi:calcineurin-like phosphoesterase family protein